MSEEELIKEILKLIEEWKEFFDNENEYQEWCKKQLKEIGVIDNDTMSKDSKDNAKQ